MSETKVDDKQIESWAALAKAATPGPWAVQDGWEQMDPGRYILAPKGLVFSPDSEIEPPDAAFIVAAREAVPLLIVRRRSAGP